ncbi:MAG TPA: MerR family transcriptional regulator [Steroidobacteraceae bacterium]|nr:MerR family transcriptional regulator [Steroidobacteraceae bacterium]
MFRIGDFSRIARVSARLLRFYDEIGLFVPAHADPQSGYRYYTVAQLGELNRILVLKDLGFNLDQVREIVSKNIDPAELRHLLLLRRNDVEQTLAAEAQRLRQIETRISQLETEGRLTADDVVVRAEPACEIISLRRTVPSFGAARELIAELREQSRSFAPRNGLLVVGVAHSPCFEADEIDVEFGLVLPDGSDIEPPAGSLLTRRTLEAVPRMAVCVRVGLPEDAHLVTAKIGRYLEASGEALSGPSREVFLKPPNPERMHESVVEMQFSVGPRRI